MKGTKEMAHGDTQLSSEIWEDLNLTGFSKHLEKSFSELRTKGYSTLVIRAAIMDEVSSKLAECTIFDSIKSRRNQS